MDKFKIVPGILLIFVHIHMASGMDRSNPERLVWKGFDVLPNPPGTSKQVGLAGVFSGTIGQNLVVAGGANFPDDYPWNGGKKKWWGDIYVRSLDTAQSEWRVFPNRLPRPLAYGVSINFPEGILCIGGNDEERSYADVFLMRYVGSSVEFEEWPSLPVPLSHMAGALINGKIYIAGGLEDMNNPGATNHFFVLDILRKSYGWEKLEPWPGPERAFAVAAGQSDGFDNCFYLFSGRNFGPDIPLEVLSDGYEYNPRLKRWKKLDGPEGPTFPVMAGTAFTSGVNHIIFIGGADGRLMEQQLDLQNKLAELTSAKNGRHTGDSIQIINDQIYKHLNNHPGFSRNVLYYHTITNTIIKGGEVPFAVPVTTNLIKLQNKVIIPSGETRPGVRTSGIIVGEFRAESKGFGFLNYTVIAVYFILLLWIGWFFSKRQKNTGDYFKGGGRLPWWAVGLSIFGTALSAITFMAIPAKSYATDWSYLLFNAGIVAVAPIIIYLFIPFYRKLNITTAYEYLEQRFNIATRIITSLAFIIFQIGRMGIVLFLPSIALNVVTGIDIFLCIGLMGIFSLLYTMMGGIEAVVWTDALQVVVLLGGAILAVVLISMDVQGGFTGIIDKGVADGKFHLADTSFDFTNPTLVTVIIATLFTSITTYGTDQTMVQRYLTTPTEKMAAKSVWTNAFLTIPASLIFFFVGTALYVFFKENPILISPTISDADAIFPSYIFTQMPPGVSGLLIAGVFAAAMSTLSSSMNSSATAYMVDIHYRFGWSKDLKGLKLPRIATLVLGIAGITFGFMMATLDIKSLWDEFQKILGLVLGSLGGLFLLGLLTRRANGVGAIIGIVGSIIVQIWISRAQPVHLLLYAATGFISCFVIGYISSLIFTASNKEVSHLTVHGLFRKRKN